jgi:PPM family protein phosphatase
VTAAPEGLPCPSCGAPSPAGNQFCEACGTGLPQAPGAATPETAVGRFTAVCVNCGSAVGADGYCQQCGYKQPDPHDHEEIDLGRVAGVTDRGLHHPRNEDAMALASGATWSAVVVCDGVSSSANAQAAAKAAVDAAIAVLAPAATAGRNYGETDLTAALTDAATAAQAAVLTVPRDGPGESPSCTFVAALVGSGTVAVAWIGDSRAYWLDAGGERRLTTDDSWATEQVAAGIMSEAAAEADPRAHSITAWLGADAAACVPHTVRFSPESHGRLLICSDGLWNYASTAAALAALLAEVPGDPTPLASAWFLTDWARRAGGHDNITVVIVE